MVVKLSNDPNCGYTPPSEPIYRWQNMNIATDYICDNYNKYYKQKKQVSYDGLTWQDVIPSEYQMGALYESNSTDCGYVPTFDGKLLAYYGSEVYTVECNGDGTLTSSETTPSGYERSGMTRAIIGNCTTSICHSAFLLRDNLKNISFPNNVTSIDSLAFAGCSGLTSVNIPDSITSIGDSAFQHCYGLTSATIGSGVTSIPDSLFFWCSGLTEVTIPDSITSIGRQSFSGCTSLTSITIPSGVTEIGGIAFANCNSLTSITCLATTPPQLGTNALWSTNNCPIYVPAESLSSYQTAWSDFASRLRAIST